MRPYFLRSFIRGSRVRNPAALRTGLYSASASRRALATPCLMAPACPIVQLKDEEIENYMSSGDDFTTSAMQSWQTSKDELGAKKDSNGETTVTFKDDQYTVTVPLKFEKAEANFVYVFDSQGTPTSMSVDVQYGMGKTLQRAGLNTLMGIGTVFVMLILLSLLISLFRFIPNPEAKKAAEAKAADGENTAEQPKKKKGFMDKVKEAFEDIDI